MIGVTEIQAAMVSAGVEVDHYQSDLHVPVTEESAALISQYEFKSIVSRFTSEIDGTRWFEIPFAYRRDHQRG